MTNNYEIYMTTVFYNLYFLIISNYKSRLMYAFFIYISSYCSVLGLIALIEWLVST
jgi:hypothetical protein